MANALTDLLASVDPVNDPSPSRELVDWLHRNAGTDRFDLHHMIGHGATDVAAGDHDHDGRNSSRPADLTPELNQVPFGALVYWPLATEPDGWTFADGSAISRTDNPRLFALYGTTFGPGDGSTTFDLPTVADMILPLG